MTVYLFGEAIEESVIRLFREAATRSGHAVRHYSQIRRLLDRLRASRKHLRFRWLLDRLPGRSKIVVLYLLADGPEWANDNVRKIKDLGARVIVFACEKKYEPVRVGLLLGSGADDVESLRAFPQSVAAVQDLIELDEPPWGPFAGLDHRTRPGAAVFLMTPFDDRRERFERACRSALKPLGLRPVLGDHRITLDANLLAKLKQETGAACFTIANLSPPFNMNVGIEIGIAHGLKVPCLLTWGKDSSNPVPADLQGLDAFQYDDEVQLVKRLFFGLRPHVTWAIHP